MLRLRGLWESKLVTIREVVATNCHGVSTGNGHGLQTDIALAVTDQVRTATASSRDYRDSCRGFDLPRSCANFNYNMP
jgi:hypothetical protein